MIFLSSRTFVLSGLFVLATGILHASEELRPHRLWLPPSSENLRELLTTAAERALEHPDCNDVLYGRLNEYRSERGETAFTILCMRDPRYTFNLVFTATDLVEQDPGTQQPDRTEDLQRLRSLLGEMPASVRAGNENNDATEQEVQVPDTSPPELF